MLFFSCDFSFSHLNTKSEIVAVLRPGYGSKTRPAASHNYVMKSGSGGIFEQQNDISSSSMRKNKTATFLSQVCYGSVVKELIAIKWAIQ